MNKEGVEYESIEAIYSHLEEKANQYKYPCQIGDLFRRKRDKLLLEKMNDDAEIAQLEIDIWHFVLTEGKLKPNVTGTDGKGEPFEYPNIKKFGEKELNYLSKRFDDSTNPVTRSRYANILWHSSKKHTKYAAAAVEADIEIIPIYEAFDKISPLEHRGLDVLHTMKNLYFISKQSNYRFDDVKGLLIKLVHEFNDESSSSFVLRFQLITLMLEEKFSKEAFKEIPSLCLDLYTRLVASGNIHGGIEVLELGAKVDARIGFVTQNWRKKVAESYETLMIEAEKKDNPASVNFAQKSLENYKLAKESSKIAELEEKFKNLKTSIKLTEISTEFDFTNHIKRCKETAQKIVAEPSKKIVDLLMHAPDLLPQYDEVAKLASMHAEQTVFLHLASTEIIDQNGNIAQHFVEEDEKRYYEILTEFKHLLQFDKLQLIHEIFLAGVLAEKLSTDVLLSYMHDNSWYGKILQKPTANGEIIEYNWLNLLAPSIHEFFAQLNNALLNPINEPNMVLAIDSLTLKLEGLFRDLCRFSGITTFFTTKDAKGRSVSREKDIHALLYEEKAVDLIDPNDMLFLRFLLVEKAGYNLRHNVAHSLMMYQEYGLHQIYLLLLALLRLGKYDFAK